METASQAQDVETLMEGPLVLWFKSCLVDSQCLRDFNDLVDGPLLYEVLQQTDPENYPSNTVQESHGDPNVRLKNLDIILSNIRSFYLEELGSYLLAQPDILLLAHTLHEPQAGCDEVPSPLGTAPAEARLLLILLLGVAVQCREKENFILKIKSLPVESQLKMVEFIKEVTEGQTIMVNAEATELTSQEALSRLLSERDRYLARFLDSYSQREREGIMKSSKKDLVSESYQQSSHQAVETAKWKSLLRQKNQELQSKFEELMECREELESLKISHSASRQEVVRLSEISKKTMLYRDELDAAKLKAEKADKLEGELCRARDRLREMGFIKILHTDLQNDNRLLLERQQELEEQLSRARARLDTVNNLEAHIACLKQNLSDSTLERDNLQEKLQEALEETTQLQLRQLSSRKEKEDNMGSQELTPDTVGDTGSLLDQLATSAQSEVVRLKLENSRLRAELENSKENVSTEKASLETALENERKKSVAKVEEALVSERNHRRLQATLEEAVRELTQEKKELGTQLQDAAINAQLLATHLQECKQDNLELSDKVYHLESVQSANEVLRAAEMSKLSQCQRELSIVRSEKERTLENLKTKSSQLDTEISKRREFENRSTELKAALRVASENIQKLAEQEQQLKIFTAKSEMLENSLGDLQSELLTEKLDKEKAVSNLEVVFTNLNSLANIETSDNSWIFDRSSIIERLSTNSELIQTLSENHKRDKGGANAKTAELQDDSKIKEDSSKIQEIAALQIKVSLLESKVSSLQSIQTALQLANSQLAAEKDELNQQSEVQRLQTSQISQDLINLQHIHETLVIEYEALVNERETFRNELKNCQRELKLAAEQINNLKITNQDQEILRMEAKTLANLRAEHSKLKEDFRQLFSASERLKTEARSRDDELRRAKVELGAVRLSARQLSSALENEKEMNVRLSARLTKADTKLQLLMQVTNSLEDDRRSLMNHVTSLLSQYHELLANSMDDKEHFHTQEKIFLERLNGLLRQKENLEQKIMDHYRRLESCSSKKKGFTHSLVKKVRKAGTEIINKVPRARSRDTSADLSRSAAEEDAETLLVSENVLHESEHTSDEETLSECGDTDTDTSLHLGSVRTRRAIYYDDAPDARTGAAKGGSANTFATTGEDEEPSAESSEPKERNVLVFNKVSAVIGTTITPCGAPVPPPKESSEDCNLSSTDHPKPESSVWYEYGCV